MTYLLRGDVEHADSMGNAGVIGSGCAQWMTAGCGIVHQEMPLGDEAGVIEGFQLWVNLPAADKMMPPRYQGVSDDQIPLLAVRGGTLIRVIAGEVDGVRGPVEGIVTDPEYLDVTVPVGASFTHDDRARPHRLRLRDRGTCLLRRGSRRRPPRPSARPMAPPCSSETETR